jgi:hypothetical protein
MRFQAFHCIANGPSAAVLHTASPDGPSGVRVSSEEEGAIAGKTLGRS